LIIDSRSQQQKQQQVVRMSLALPLFQDLTKAAQDVLYGNVQGEGVFTTGAQVKSQTMTAGVLPSPASLAEKVTPLMLHQGSGVFLNCWWCWGR
jgi:hypothetical protein